jgi:hypothetical protein
MNTLLLLPLHKKRDLLQARALSRQAASLLGLAPQDQTCLAAAVFDLALQALKPTGRAAVRFDVVDDCLQVVCTAVAGHRRNGPLPEPLRLSKPLPTSATVPREDVPWMLRQLTEFAKGDLFEEVCKLNQELLQTLLALAKCQTLQPKTSPKKKEPNAA